MSLKAVCIFSASAADRPVRTSGVSVSVMCFPCQISGFGPLLAVLLTFGTIACTVLGRLQYLTGQTTMVVMYRSIGVGVALLLLGGCDWLGFGSSSTNSEKARPGAERQVNVTNSLPAARASGYDASVTPVDETRSAPKIGSVVAGKGGQKA